MLNTVKSKVVSEVNEIFDRLQQGKNPNNYCTCNQCRLDVACYVLNRTPPHYIVSHRGATRAQIDGFERQQHAADISTLVQEGLKKINENLRPHSHQKENEAAVHIDSSLPVFIVPTILGRIFNGNNFEPLSDVNAELLYDGELVKMKDGNWRNPLNIVSIVEGNFSFWPAPVKASGLDIEETFHYTIRVTAKDFEPLTHFFKIPVKSEILSADSSALDRKFKLPDLHMFPPGEAEKNDSLD